MFFIRQRVFFEMFAVRVPAKFSRDPVIVNWGKKLTTKTIKSLLDSGKFYRDAQPLLTKFSRSRVFLHKLVEVVALFPVPGIHFFQ
jgi:hypothetical protein